MKLSRLVIMVAASLGVASVARAAAEPQFFTGYGDLPLSFETNAGQTDARVSFVSRGPGYALYLSPTEAVLALHKVDVRRDQSALSPDAVRMTLLGANPQAASTATEQLPGAVNYFIGNDPARWHHTIPLYARAGFGGAYHGVDLTYYGTQGQLEYDFTVAPGTDPRVINLGFDGVRQTRIDPNGDLVLCIARGNVRFHAPRAYQSHDGQSQDVPSRYVMTGNNRVGFLVADYDRHLPLIIDPVLVYSTYLGGNSGYYGDYGNAIAVDAAGCAYIAGGTESPNFPTLNAFQTNNAGTSISAFITKLGPGGSNLVYSTYLGGSVRDCGNGIAVDASGNVYVSGWTLSSNFPIRNAFQPTLRGGTNAYVAKFGPGGSNLIYSSYLGGDGSYLNDWANALAIDTAGCAYVTGSTTSTNFPTQNAFQPTLGTPVGNAFVTKVGPDGSNLIYSTYLGGNGPSGDTGFGIAVDAAGSAYVAGYTSSTNFPTMNPFQASNLNPANCGFVTKLGPDGSNLLYSTYLGGSGANGDYSYAIAVDAAGCAYVTGFAGSTNYPTTPNAFQKTLPGTQSAFVTKLGPGGSNLVYSTYLGGNYIDAGYGIGVDAATNAYVTGYTFSKDFPLRNAFQKTLTGEANPFVTEVGPTGTNLVYSSYLGGSDFDLGYAIAVDATGNAYVTGSTTSPDFPTTNAFQSVLRSGSGNAFVTKVGGLGSALRITSIARQSNNMRVTWTTAGGESYILQTNTPPSGSNYSNTFADFGPVFTTPGRAVSTTNYLDTGAVTNFTSRYYRIRLVP